MIFKVWSYNFIIRKSIPGKSSRFAASISKEVTADWTLLGRAFDDDNREDSSLSPSSSDSSIEDVRNF